LSDDDDDKVEFAGDYMTFVEDDKGDAYITFGDVGTGRKCGECGLCCKLLGVPVPLNKPAGVKCVHSRHGKGCTIYKDRPFACRSWSCRWVADPTTAGMPRPDRCHYVIDLQYDHIRMTDSRTGVEDVIPALQVWVDPAFPNAHRAPELRAYIAALSEKWHVAAIIRLGSEKGILLYPPAVSADRQWHEVHDSVSLPEAEFKASLRGKIQPKTITATLEPGKR
jgi:hypothetical protein